MKTRDIADDDLQLMDKARTAQRLNISTRTLDNRIKAGVIPFVKLGKLIRFIPADVQQFIESKRIVAQLQPKRKRASV